eukprot:TRINITY_DN48393_c0_g1_i1.p1 TRINITY_DN48393_c0_g1~~TRINITY_DN48393_c0_g1_i1.p1  ORF type:complete len:417 (+),score=84.47 TRINITY_DN48393_c0_g1_i1:53-1252(+)
MTPEVAAEDLAQLQDKGYIVVKNVLSEELCETLRTHILLCTDEAVKQDRNDLLGNIQEAHNRSDLKLNMCEPVVDALNSFGDKCGELLTETCGGDARIVELAAISSSKGAVAQPVHADTMHGVTRFLQSDIDVVDRTRKAEAGDSDDEDAAEDLQTVVRAVATNTALIFTSLIALQDVDADMGPTHVWPASHTVEHHATLWSTSTDVAGKLSVPEADKAFGIDHSKMTLKKGDLVLYDSRVMHCGGANNSDKRRSLMCISVMGPGIRPDGTTWTMLKRLRSRNLTLGRLPVSKEGLDATIATDESNVSAALPPVEEPAGNKKKEAAKGDDAGGSEPRPIPPLEEWEACVQCSFCRKWRPCGQLEAPKLMSSDSGFWCSLIGFSCNQEQKYTSREIDAMF